MSKVCAAARALGITGLLAVALTGTSGCIRLGNDLAIGADRSQATDSVASSAVSKMDYSITGVEVHDSDPTWREGKVVVIRWHVVNNSTHDEYAVTGFSVYQNKIRLNQGATEDVDCPDTPMLAPGGEFDGIDVYDIADLSPIEIKLDDTTQTFNLE